MKSTSIQRVTMIAHRLAGLYGDDFLDDLIHDLHDSLGSEALNALSDRAADAEGSDLLDSISLCASGINNQGVEGQVAWLCWALGECEALRAIEGVARELDQQLKSRLKQDLDTEASAGSCFA